jgi:hypothetical protein
VVTTTVDYDLEEEGHSLTVQLTQEGVIFDYYFEGNLVLTEGMMADEWVEWMQTRAEWRGLRQPT